MAYTHPDASSDDDNDYHIGQDADTLKRHNEITSDPKRHAAAHKKLMEQTQAHSSALDASHKALKQRVKKGLKQSFPSNLQDKTPYQKDEASGGTPFEEASGK